MVLRLNGVVREVPDGLTAAALLALLGVKDGRVAMAVNGALLARDERAARRLEKGDAVEIVPLLGGV
jgi:sulfur carrier protein